MKIKTMLLVISALALAASAGIYLTRDNSTRQKPAPVSEEAAVGAVLPEIAPRASEPRAVKENPASGQASATETRPATTAPGANTLAEPKTPSQLVLEQATAVLISPKAPYDQKQAAWKQIRDAGKLDLLITDLEQRASSSPSLPELPATLGQAYLQKAGTLTDIREQGILGMKADQSFDASLNLDEGNWEARFWKATAMSYWPPQLGKGKDVIEHCLTLLKQQELQPPQPQHAQTYVLLGEQYEKQGHPEYAQQVWKRGLGLFPENATLQQKNTQAK
jgi:hypothetical protein